MQEREKRALARLGKLALAAVLPVLVASLQVGEPDGRALAVALTVALLGALEKFLTWEERPPAPQP